MYPNQDAVISPLRAWYSARIADFMLCRPESVLGCLAEHSDFALNENQRDAWIAEIRILHAELRRIEGHLFLEFSIPRMGRRADAVLIVNQAIFVIEFKIGQRHFERSALNQVWDYALDLKNFHQGSHDAAIFPILAIDKSRSAQSTEFCRDPDGVFHPIPTASSNLRTVLLSALRQASGPALNAAEWAGAPYHPTPTIIEAARALYSQHSVEAIARFDAGAKNLQTTSGRIEELSHEARSRKRKLICFVTGVPGAGKTLVGLNLAAKREDLSSSHAVFLSGNGPLVAVLREALTRDEYQRRKSLGERTRKGVIKESVKSFIQNVHHFRDEGLIDDRAPNEHIVIFDEAQRAWNLKKTADFMNRKKRRPGFSQSEAEFLISCMDRHSDWAVIVCLVGGGQEINTGEAGIGEWVSAIHRNFPEWRMFISGRLTDSEYAAGKTLEIIQKRPSTHFDNSLHLAVSMRSFRAEHVSQFVKALLDCEQSEARNVFETIDARYPIAVTRNLDSAKQWIRSHARGSERYGLMASSKAMRLKPHAIDIRVNVDPVHYFLNQPEDPRSSFYLEDAATEFQVQGLELDWTCVTWDGDFRFNGSGWNFHDFRGHRWVNMANADNKTYLRNAYRVLLTRARQGMVIFVPPGDSRDPTRPPGIYDPTFKYLRDLGIPEIG